MRRRLARLLIFLLVVPIAVAAADALAERLEAAHGPTTPSKLLRQGSHVGRTVQKYGRRL